MKSQTNFFRLLLFASVLMLAHCLVQATEYRVISKSGVNVRQGPGTQYGIIGSVPYDYTVVGDTSIQDWTRIVNLSSGLNGFIKSDLLQAKTDHKKSAVPPKINISIKQYITTVLWLIFLYILTSKLISLIKKRKNKNIVESNDSPFTEEDKIEKRNIIQDLITASIIGGFLAIIGLNAENSLSTPSNIYDIIVILLFFLIGVGFIPGWRFLSNLTTDFIFIAPIITWFVLFIFKFTISLCIGIFFAPSFLVSHIQRLYRLIKKEHQYNSR